MKVRAFPIERRVGSSWDECADHRVLVLLPLHDSQAARSLEKIALRGLGLPVAEGVIPSRQ